MSDATHPVGEFAGDRCRQALAAAMAAIREAVDTLPDYPVGRDRLDADETCDVAWTRQRLFEALERIEEGKLTGR